MTPTRRSRCRSHRSTLDAVLDGREGQAALQSLELHADDCDECARALAESLALRAALDALPAPEFDRSSDDAFVASVMGRVDSDGGARPVAPRRILWGVVGATVAAAAAILLTVLSPGDPDRPTNADETVVEVATAPDPGPLGTGPPDVDPVTSDPETELPPIVQEATASAAPDELAVVLDAIDSEGTYDPYDSLSAAAFVQDVRSRVDGDLGAAARILLAGGGAPRRAALAARLLGPGADYRDRDLLTKAIGVIGEPAAFALADRGGAGVERLWRLAVGDDDSARLAQETLRLLAAEGEAARDPFAAVPRSTPVRIAAPVAAADRLAGAARALGEYLADGDPLWLSVLIEHDRCAETIDDAVVAGVRPRDRQRMLTVIERSGVASTVGFVLANMERGDIAAVDALVALPADVVLEHLLEATQSGVLRAEVEESAWRAFVRVDADEIESLVAGWRPEQSWNIDVLLDALVRAGMLAPEDGEHASARRLVITLAALEGGDPLVRVAALVHVASASETGAAFNAVEREHLDRLLLAPNVDIAAAAWLVRAEGLGPSDSVPPSVRRALDRGGDPSVRLLRVARALGRDRAAAARRARVGAAP